ERVRGRHLRRNLSEQAKEVLVRLVRDSLERHAAGLRQHLGRLEHIGRLVALAAMAAGGEIGRVGLDEYAVCRQALRDGAKLIRFFEGEAAGERDEETKRDRSLREFAAA